jgi:hypothetical protein
MKTRLSRISPGDIALFFGVISFAVSIPLVIFAFLVIAPGRTVNLKGFLSFTFTGSLEPIWLVLAYPLLNALADVIGGFITAWFYNIYARFFKGISIDLDQQ